MSNGKTLRGECLPLPHTVERSFHNDLGTNNTWLVNQNLLMSTRKGNIQIHEKMHVPHSK